MPAADTNRARRSTRLLPTTLFWAGVALAPLAVLLFLVSTGAFAMQIAAVLAVAALSLMGVALWLSRDGDSVRVEVEGIVFEEIDAARGEIRNDIAHATRTSHKQLGERIAVLSQTVESLRGQLDYVRGQLERAGQPQSHQSGPQHHTNPPGGLLRHTETVQVTTRQTTLVDSSDGRRDGTVYGGRPQGTGEYGTGEFAAGEYGGRARVDYPPPTDNGVPSHFGGRATVPARAEPRPEPRPDPQPEPRPEPWNEPRSGDLGVPPAFGGRSYGAAQVPLQRPPESFGQPARPGETYGQPARTGEIYGQPARTGEIYGGQPERTGEIYGSQPAPAIDAGPREESWTEQLLRERLNRRDRERVSRDDDWGERTSGGRRRAYDSDDYSGERTTGGLSASGTAGYGSASGTAGYGSASGSTSGSAGDAPGYGRTEGFRTTDRWAEVRSDERGRELQMGERRAQMREGERGSEIRIEDRWAAVRREDDRRRQEEGRREGDWRRPEEDRRADEHWQDDLRGSGEWSEGPRRSPASRERARSRALPGATSGSGGSAEPVPSWASGWANASRDDPETTTGRRRRDEDETYRWNEGRDVEPPTPRRLVGFEHTDDRWR